MIHFALNPNEWNEAARYEVNKLDEQTKQVHDEKNGPTKINKNYAGKQAKRMNGINETKKRNEQKNKRTKSSVWK